MWLFRKLKKPVAMSGIRLAVATLFAVLLLLTSSLAQAPGYVRVSWSRPG
jgi:hypothetical protein